MNSKIVFLSLFIILFISCSKQVEDAQSIVDKSINAHSGELYENSKVEFDFRDRHYIFERNQGLYTYHRIFDDSLGNYHDILSNDGFKRLLNDNQVSVSSDWISNSSHEVRVQFQESATIPCLTFVGATVPYDLSLKVAVGSHSSQVQMRDGRAIY